MPDAEHSGGVTGLDERLDNIIRAVLAGTFLKDESTSEGIELWLQPFLADGETARKAWLRLFNAGNQVLQKFAGALLSVQWAHICSKVLLSLPVPGGKNTEDPLHDIWGDVRVLKPIGRESAGSANPSSSNAPMANQFLEAIPETNFDAWLIEGDVDRILTWAKLTLEDSAKSVDEKKAEALSLLQKVYANQPAFFGTLLQWMDESRIFGDDHDRVMTELLTMEHFERANTLNFTWIGGTTSFLAHAIREKNISMIQLMISYVARQCDVAADGAQNALMVMVNGVQRDVLVLSVEQDNSDILECLFPGKMSPEVCLQRFVQRSEEGFIRSWSLLSGAADAFRQKYQSLQWMLNQLSDMRLTEEQALTLMNEVYHLFLEKTSRSLSCLHEADKDQALETLLTLLSGSGQLSKALQVKKADGTRIQKTIFAHMLEGDMRNAVHQKSVEAVFKHLSLDEKMDLLGVPEGGNRSAFITAVKEQSKYQYSKLAADPSFREERTKALLEILSSCGVSIEDILRMPSGGEGQESNLAAFVEQVGGNAMTWLVPHISPDVFTHRYPNEKAMATIDSKEKLEEAFLFYELELMAREVCGQEYKPWAFLQRAFPWLSRLFGGYSLTEKRAALHDMKGLLAKGDPCILPYRRCGHDLISADERITRAPITTDALQKKGFFSNTAHTQGRLGWLAIQTLQVCKANQGQAARNGRG